MKKGNIIKTILKNKSSKLYLLGFLLVGSLVSSSISFAKYVEEFKEHQQAGVADFKGYKVTYSSSPIPLPSTANDGIYAYVGYFKVEFESSEVRRSYSLSIKDVANNATDKKEVYDNEIVGEVIHIIEDGGAFVKWLSQENGFMYIIAFIIVLIGGVSLLFKKDNKSDENVDVKK